jgi:hypothetical protein
MTKIRSKLDIPKFDILYIILRYLDGLTNSVVNYKYHTHMMSLRPVFYETMSF